MNSGGGSKVKQRNFPIAPIPPSIAQGMKGGDYGTISSLADPFGAAGGRQKALAQYEPAIQQLISSIGGLSDYAKGISQPGLTEFTQQGNLGEWNLDVLRGISAGQDPFYKRLLNLVANPSLVQNIPGYQFGMQQGMGNLQRQLAASGMSGSGAAMGELMKFAQGYASQQFTNQEQILGNLAQMSMSSRAGTAQQTFADLINRQQAALAAQQAALGAKESILGARTTGMQAQAGLTEFLSNLAGGNVSPVQPAQLVENMWNTQYTSAYGTPAQAAEVQMAQQKAAGSAWGSLAGHVGGALQGAGAGYMVGGPIGAVAGGITGLLSSDRRVKKNIKKLGINPDTGLMMYSFDYKKKAPKHVGYMADEVEKLYPEAVVTGPDGFKRVNYAMLEAA